MALILTNKKGPDPPQSYLDILENRSAVHCMHMYHFMIYFRKF